MNANRNADRITIETTSRTFLAALAQLAEALPDPAAPTIRLATVSNGQTLGHVDIDTTTLTDLARVIFLRAEHLPALLPRPVLRVVGSGE